MALHQIIQRALLFGTDLGVGPAPPRPVPPNRLQALIGATAPNHQRYDELAVDFGHRYRSAFWAIYLLSAVAVLFAVMPLALGWDDSRHGMHPWLFLWALCEVVIIFVVGVIYFVGHRRDWQGQWLWTRTQAELTWYLPVIAPLVDFEAPAPNPDNWYARVYDSVQPIDTADDVTKLCIANERLAAQSLKGAWEAADFRADYARYTIELLNDQRHYHSRVAKRQRALLHRVHAINTRLFAITAVGALTHLVVHSLWLSVLTTFFPALGASLHGALAQSEAYRLAVTSERLVDELKVAVGRIEAASVREGEGRTAALRDAVRDAIGVILEEHQDWHMLVRPHHLPLG